MENEKLEKLRKKVDYSRGLRKALAEAELVEALVPTDNAAAMELVRTLVARARSLYAGAVERNMSLAPYRNALAYSLRSLAYSLKTAKNFAESEESLRESIHLFEQLNEGSELIRCHQLLHLLYRDQGHSQAALQALDKALALARETGYDRENAAILGERGTVLSLLGKRDEAVVAFEQGLDLARRQQNYKVQIILLGNMSNFYLGNMHTIDKAKKLLLQSIELERRHKAIGPLNLVVAIWTICMQMRFSGKLRSTLVLIDEGIVTASAANLSREHALFLFLKAQIHFAYADYSLALELLYRVFAVREGNAEDVVSAKSWALLAHIFSAIGDSKSADDAARRSSGILSVVKTKSYVEELDLLTAVYLLASLPCAISGLQKYTPLFFEAKSKYAKMNLMQKIPGFTVGLGLLLEQKGDDEGALKELKSAVHLNRELQRRFSLVESLYHLGRLYGKHRDYRSAITSLLEALELAVEFGCLHKQRRIHGELARMFELADKLQESTRHYRAERTLERQTLSPEILLSLLHTKQSAVYEHIHREHEVAIKDLSIAQENIAALQRQVQTKNTHIAHLSDRLATLEQDLRQYADENTSVYLKRINALRNDLRSALDSSSWREFEREAIEYDEDFLARLSQRYPKLTATERKICSLIRLNNTTTDLSRLLNISTRSVQSYRYRIRKKLNLPPNSDLYPYLLEI